MQPIIANFLTRYWNHLDDFLTKQWHTMDSTKYTAILITVFVVGFLLMKSGTKKHGSM